MYRRFSVHINAVAILLAVGLTLPVTAVGQQQAINFGPSTPLQFIEHSGALRDRCVLTHDLTDPQGKQLTAG